MASHWSRSLESNATVRADYALTTTTIWRSIEQYWLYEWCDVNWSDWEGCDHWASDNVTVRSGRKSVWLVRQHGAHHEGSGLPEDQRPKQPVRDHSECGIWVWPGGVMIRALNSGVTIIFGPSGKHSLRAVVHLWTSNASSNRRFGPPGPPGIAGAADG